MVKNACCHRLAGAGTVLLCPLYRNLTCVQKKQVCLRATLQTSHGLLRNMSAELYLCSKRNQVCSTVLRIHVS